MTLTLIFKVKGHFQAIFGHFDHNNCLNQVMVNYVNAPFCFCRQQTSCEAVEARCCCKYFFWSCKLSSAQQLSRQKRLLKRQIVSSTAVAASMSRNLDDNEQSLHYNVDLEGPTVKVPAVIEPA